MNKQKDMSPFARAMRVKLGLVQPHSEPGQNGSKTSSTELTEAEELYKTLYPDLTDAEREELSQVT